MLPLTQVDFLRKHLTAIALFLGNDWLGTEVLFVASNNIMRVSLTVFLKGLQADKYLTMALFDHGLIK